MHCIMIETVKRITCVQLGITAPEFPGLLWLACGGGTRGATTVCTEHAHSVLKEYGQYIANWELGILFNVGRLLFQAPTVH